MAILVIFSLTAEGYFEYKQDCKHACQAQQISCEIYEITPEEFHCTCIRSPNVCEQQATTSKVCLRPEKKAIGGEDIWDNYNRHKHGTTTENPFSSTTMEPPQKDSCLIWKIGTGTSTSIIALVATGVAVLIFTERRRRAGYANLNQRAEGSVYLETVEDL